MPSNHPFYVCILQMALFRIHPLVRYFMLNKIIKIDVSSHRSEEIWPTFPDIGKRNEKNQTLSFFNKWASGIKKKSKKKQVIPGLDRYLRMPA